MVGIVRVVWVGWMGGVGGVDGKEGESCSGRVNVKHRAVARAKVEHVTSSSFAQRNRASGRAKKVNGKDARDFEVSFSQKISRIRGDLADL